jgi:menaquinone-dependent protoporphyrinogen IX oxidase
MGPSNILVVYYSRSGTTRKLAEAIALAAHGDIEEIIEKRGSRAGILGYVRSLIETAQRRAAPIQESGKDPSSYRLVTVGSPVWAGSMSSPVQSYLTANRERLRAVAFFGTYGGRGSESMFAQMQALVGKTPQACCAVKAADVASGSHSASVQRFVEAL